MDVNDLESAINSAKSPRDDPVGPDSVPISEAPKMSEDEEIGFHKGAISVLMAERNELVKMIGNVEAITGAHAKRLKEMGVDLK
jgi:hypothetical protein